MLKNGHPGLAGHGPRQQRLAGSGRSDQQHTTWNACADRQILGWVAQEVDYLREISLRFIGAGHIGKRHLRLILRVAPRAIAPESEHSGLGACLLTPHPHQQSHHQQDRQSVGQQDDKPRRRGCHDFHGDVVRLKEWHQGCITDNAREGGAKSGIRGLLLLRTGLLLSTGLRHNRRSCRRGGLRPGHRVREDPTDCLTDDANLRHVASSNLGHKFAVRKRDFRGLPREEPPEIPRHEQR